jgi:hypothetical protein
MTQYSYDYVRLLRASVCSAYMSVSYVSRKEARDFAIPAFKKQAALLLEGVK